MWREKISNQLAPPSRFNAEARSRDCAVETTHFQRPTITGEVRVLPESRCQPKFGSPPAQTERRVHACSPEPVLWSEPVAVKQPQRAGYFAHLSGLNPWPNRAKRRQIRKRSRGLQQNRTFCGATPSNHCRLWYIAPYSPLGSGARWRFFPPVNVPLTMPSLIRISATFSQRK